MLFKWRHHELGDDEWDPDLRFKTESQQPRDYFTRQERAQLREAALEYGSIPGYTDVTSEQRNRSTNGSIRRYDNPAWDKNAARTRRSVGVPSRGTISCSRAFSTMRSSIL